MQKISDIFIFGQKLCQKILTSEFFVVQIFYCLKVFAVLKKSYQTILTVLTQNSKSIIVIVKNVFFVVMQIVLHFLSYLIVPFHRLSSDVQGLLPLQKQRFLMRTLLKTFSLHHNISVIFKICDMWFKLGKD